MILAEIGPYFA